MLRLTIFSFLICFMVAGFSLAKDESVDQLKARFQSARAEDKPGLGIQIARDQLRTADKLYSAGNSEQARAAVDDIVAFSEKARDAATQTNKHVKNVEIDVRKIADKLRDIKRNLAFEDQAPVDQAIQRLEDIRTTLLNAMFAKKEKK